MVENIKDQIKSKGVQGLSAAKKKRPVKKKGRIDHARAGLEVVSKRNQYYRDGFKKMSWIVTIEAAVLLALIVGLITYMNISKPKDVYFATTSDGRIMDLVPLNRPNMQKAALLSWAAQASSEVMTFGFHDYRTRLQESSAHYTRRGWESFTEALEKSRILETVRTSQLIVTAVPKSAPVIISEGLFDGKYRWVVEMDLLVTYQSGTQSQSTTMHLTLTIDRVPTLDSVNGVGIEQWIAM